MDRRARLASMATEKRQQNFMALSERDRQSSFVVKEKDAWTLLETRLITVFQAKAAAATEAMKKRDTEGKGSLLPSQIKAALEECSISLTDLEMSLLFQAREEASGSEEDAKYAPVEYVEFVSRYSEQASTASTVDEARVELSATIRAKHETLVKAWSHMDRQSNQGIEKGKLSVAQLASAFQRVKIGLQASLARSLAKSLDSDGDGNVVYTDFVKMFSDFSSDFGRPSSGGSESPAVLEWSDELEAEIRQANPSACASALVFKGKFDSLVVAFRTFDKDKDGKVSREEMKQGLVNLKLPLSLAQINAIVKRADADGSGEVDYTEFKDMFATGLKAEQKRAEQLEAAKK
ncbi:hypothetical protein T484DRAFT_1776509, partial [Baffinella frigidus]